MNQKVLMAQSNNPTKDDWTEQVKLDLKDFQREADLIKITKNHKIIFKNHVKVKAAEYEYRRLKIIKQKHSKMDNLKYSKLQLQGYLIFPIFSWDHQSAHLGYEVITPKCLNTTMYFWPW